MCWCHYFSGNIPTSSDYMPKMPNKVVLVDPEGGGCIVGLSGPLPIALGITYQDGTRSIDLFDLTNVHMIKTRMTALAVKTFRSLENTQCFKELMLKHEIVQKRSGCNTILDQLLAAIQADA